MLGVEAPESIKGHTQSQFDGVSMRDSFDDASAASKHKTQFYAMLGSRSIWHEGWKAVTTHPLGFYAIAGSSLFVGRQPGEPVTDDYPGESPYRFIAAERSSWSRSTSAASQFTDLEHHAAMLLKHQ